MIMINNNLRIFITAAETGNLTETAKKLYISQPAVSQAIRKLEEELGIRLFIRDKRSSLKLTDVGNQILSLAYQMADLENRLYQTAFDENHLMGGSVRIASVPLGVSLILSPLLPSFRKRFPQVHVELLEGNPLDVKNMVMNHRADIGISTSPYMGMEHHVLMHDRMVSINRDRKLTIDLHEHNQDLVLCKVASESILEQLSGKGVDISHALIVEAASTQIKMIADGNGKGVISQQMLSTIPNDLKHGNVLPEVEVEISLIAHSFDELSPAAAEIVKMITNI